MPFIGHHIIPSMWGIAHNRAQVAACCMCICVAFVCAASFFSFHSLSHFPSMGDDRSLHCLQKTDLYIVLLFSCPHKQQRCVTVLLRNQLSLLNHYLNMLVSAVPTQDNFHLLLEFSSIRHLLFQGTGQLLTELQLCMSSSTMKGH